MLKKIRFPSIYVTGVFGALLLAYHLIFRDYFPLPNGRMGHDYILTLGGFLDGALWFRNNGFFTPPWFTPSFCGGQALFADPQSAFYSIPQFLTFLLDPLQAVYVAFLTFAALGFWGMYRYTRSCLQLNRLSALVAGTVFMFNGFYAHRMIIGHYGYQAFMLVPLIAYLLIKKSNRQIVAIDHLLQTLIAGILIAYWFHSGLTTLMIPAALAVVALACVAAISTRQKLSKAFVIRGLIASALAICLGASKLNANLTLISNFSRDYYLLPGISNPIDIFTFIFQSLFYTGEHAYQTVTPLWKNIQWGAMPHELAYGVTPIPLSLCLIGFGAYMLRQQKQESNPLHEGSLPLLASAILILILMAPIALLYYSPAWNAFLKQIPIIGSTTSPFRWLIIFIPAIAATTAIACEKAGGLQKPLILFALIAIPALNALENQEYYKQQDYDPAPIIDYSQAVQRGEATPRIKKIGDFQSADNAQLAAGISPARCYNPLYGYRLEKLQTQPLILGPIDSVTPTGTLNLRNPACLIFPSENKCHVWDAFTTRQLAEAYQFADYKPFPFVKSERQMLADWLTGLTLLAIPIFLIIATYIHLKRSRQSKASRI